jgi:hypothetical protein
VEGFLKKLADGHDMTCAGVLRSAFASAGPLVLRLPRLVQPYVRARNVGRGLLHTTTASLLFRTNMVSRALLTPELECLGVNTS